MTEEPVEIVLTLTHDLETEGKKATDSIDNISSASAKMKAEFEANIAAQKKVISQLTTEVDTLKKMLEGSVSTNDKQLISEKQKLADEVANLTARLAEAESAMTSMQSTQQAASKNIVSDTEKMTSATRDYAFANKNELTESINIQKKVIADLKNEIAAAQAKMKENSDVAYSPRTFMENQKQTKIVADLKKELQGENEALTELQSRMQAYAQKSATLEVQIRQVREAMAQLTLEGKKNSQEYTDLEKKLQVLGTAYREVFNTQKALSTGGTQMAGVLSGLSALSGMLAAGAGAFGLINSESENFNKIQTKVQSLMAITIGLQQISTALHKTSAFRITTVTKAKELWAIATTKLAVALGISNVAAQALMATLTLGLSIAITAVIAAISTFTKKQREAAEETKKFNESVAESAAGTIATFAKLKKEFESLNGNVQKQTEYIEDHKKEFESLGIAVTDVNEAERLFSEQGAKAFTASIEARAKAMAHMKIAADKYQEYLLGLDKANERERNPNWVDKETIYADVEVERKNDKGEMVKVKVNAMALKAADKIRDDAAKSLDAFTKHIQGNVDETKKAEEEMAKAAKSSVTIVDYTKAYWEKQKKDAQEALAAMTDAQKGTAEWNKQLDLYKQATKKLETWNFNNNNNKGQDKEIKDQQDYAQKRQDMIRAEVELQFAASQAKVDAMKEGADKELEQMKLNHEKELAELDKHREDFAKRQFEADVKNKDKVFDSKKPGLSFDQEIVFSGIKSDTLKNQQRELAEFYKKALSDYQTYAEAVKSLNEKYNSDKGALIGLGASDANLAELERQRNEALEKLSTTFAEKSELYENWLVGVAAMSIDTLRLELANAQKVLLATTEGKSDNNNTEKVAQLRAKITVLEKIIRDLSVKKTKKEGDTTKKSIEDWNELRDALADVKNEFAEIGNEIGGIGGEIISQSGQIAASTLQMIDGITTLANWSVTATEMAAKGASKAIIAVERASIILAVISTAIQIASKIITLLKGQDKSAKDTEELKRTSEKISDVYEAINKQLEKRIDLIKEAGGAEAEYLNTLNQKAIDEAKKYYKGLFSGGTNSDGRRSDASTVVGANSGLMSNEIFGKEGKNNDLSLKQIMDMFGLTGIEDFAKWWSEGGYYELLTKGYTITNQEYWDQLAKNWNNLTEASKESAQAMNEQWAGFSFDSFKDKLDDLVKDVNTTAADIADSFTGTIEDSILSWVKSTYLDKEMQKWYDELANSYSDGVLSDDEYAQLEAMYTGIFGKAKDMYDMAAEAAGVDIKAQDRQASQKGIAAASQDSMDELNGRFTAIQGMTSDIRNTNSEILSVQKDALIYQKSIKSQLDTIAENSGYLKHLESIKSGIDDLNLKGVKIKV